MENETIKEGIHKQLIRNRFDALTDENFFDTAPYLIQIARDCGFEELAEEMSSDMRLELTPVSVDYNGSEDAQRKGWNYVSDYLRNNFQ